MPPITLTRAQFLQRRPQGSYQAYRSYIANRRAAPAAAAAPNPFGSLISAYQGYVQTPGQMRAAARQDVNDQIRLAVAQNTAAAAAQKQQYANQAERAQGFALALAQATQPDPAALASQYRESAGRLRAYGTGLTGAVEQAQQAAAEKSRQAVANLTGGLGTVGGYDPAAIRNVAQMTGVTLPGTTLEEQAASAFQRAGAARAASAAQIGQLAQGYLQKRTDLETALAAKNAELQLTRPELLRKATTSYEQQQRQNVATLAQALALQGTLGLKTAQTAATTAKTTGKLPGGGAASGQWYNPITKAYEPLGTNSTVVKFNGVPTRVPVGYTVKHTKGGDVMVPPPKAPTPGAGQQKKPSPQQIQTAINNASTKIGGALGKDGGPYAEITNPALVYAGFPPKFRPRMSYAQAYKRLLAYIPPAFQNQPQVKQMIDDWLSRYGYAPAAMTTPSRGTPRPTTKPGKTPVGGPR